VSIELLSALVAGLLAIYALFVLGLLLLGRRSQARALAGFIPDCIVLMRRLLGDERVPRSRKLSLVLLLGYLALPIDLIPDFIPVAGQLDDAILVAAGLRFVLRGGGPPLLEEHWPGPDPGLRLIEAIAFGFRGRAAGSSRAS
jgi:uncharacterized membrane protein YkvA (DUF1232 family)